MSPTPGSAGSASATPAPGAGASTTVNLPNGSRLVLTLPNRFLSGPGESLTLGAQLFDAAGNPIPLGDLRLLFSSSRPQDFSVNDRGLITALTSDGFSTITVRIDGTDLSASQLISVFTATSGGSGGGGGGGPRPTPTPFEDLEIEAGFEGLGLGEFRVNTQQVAHEYTPRIAMDDDGDAVVVWKSSYGGYSIRAQRYNSLGVPQGQELTVSTNGGFAATTSTASLDVAIDSDGDFVVTWLGYDADGYGIFARRYSALGLPQSDEFRVNATPTGNQVQPAIGMDDDGDFVITWSQADGYFYGIAARRFNRFGIAQGSELAINNFTTDRQIEPEIAMDSDGDFAIVWSSNVQEGGGYGIYARRFDSLGVAQDATEFRVNETIPGDQLDATIALSDNGGFVVGWSSQSGLLFDVYARRFGSTGDPLGSEFRVNGYTTGNQLRPALAMADDGDFVVTWDSLNETPGAGTSATFSARRFDGAGVAQGGDFQVNSFEYPSDSGTGTPLRYPDVAIDADGDFMITWQSLYQDDVGLGIYAKKFNASAQAQ